MQAFSDRHAASEAAATLLSRCLATRLRSDATATLMVSGGSTPGDCFDALSRNPLDWSRVTVTLTDERIVSIDDPRSNEKMVRDRLITRNASAAGFQPLERGPLTFMSTPFACSLVGMGEDGHFASLFPDLPELPVLLDLSAEPVVAFVSTESSHVDRWTMNLPAIVWSNQVVVLAFGARKKQILESPAGLPIGTLLKQSRTPTTVVWAP